jgi:osmotically-inducible protein OsmY
MRSPSKTDHDVQQDVLCELAWDTRVSPMEVGVLVKDGVVTLVGTVDSWAKVHAAEQAAHRVSGVRDVANNLSVKLPDEARRTDTEIALAVRRALEWDIRVPNGQIESTISEGTVTLEGTVPLWSQSADAEAAVAHLFGVRRVLNHIAVIPTESLDLEAVQTAVERALERHAEREASRIALAATNGTVEASGVVETTREKTAVLGAVRGTRGVRAVVDRLVVRPSLDALRVRA